eukprot:CAMPEP_0173292148 /NCGR_PEP_ID=MMETSP1143-20121109/12564_1 /TAXON_ID=483371 /ORGANISM="non described non described, Strain CCMP2298" /LENGTH=57 /DNA_ID=CAMNT_0014231497 /DNA_START=97 /DNA_END=267 /DNA_ORIENTATION=-
MPFSSTCQCALARYCTYNAPNTTHTSKPKTARIKPATTATMMHMCPASPISAAAQQS